MQLFTGHPTALKTAFLNFIKENKQNPFDKVLIVLPARRLETSLKRAAAARLGCVGALYFTDFLQLAQNIAGGKPLLPNNYKQDFILKNILQKYGFAFGRGYTGALKNSFRDLASAQVSTQDLINLKNDETLLTPEQKDYLGKTAVLYNDYMRALKTPDYSTYYEAFQNAAGNAQNSAWLKDFKHIIFYGFYDFTGVQFELFKSINDNFDITVFFPYEDNPAYKFAAGFYESNILAKAKKINKLPPPKTPFKNLADNLFSASPARAAGAPLKIISVSGASAELEAAAKEILRFKEDLGIDFKDIALTARSMEPYKNDASRVLTQNLIPHRCNFDAPLTSHPLGAFIFNLFTLAQNNFYRDDVLAAITSPYFKNRRPQWQGVIKNIGITAGYNQWLDLLPLSPAKDDARQISVFLERLKNLLARAAQSGGFDILAQTARDIIEIFLIPQDKLTPAENSILTTVFDLLSQLESFKEIRPQAAPGEFMAEFCAMLKEQTFSTASDAQNGVIVADIMSMRGQDFKAVIIIGLNEGLLPAPAREDPALKDIYRKTLQGLGFLIHKQNDRYEEEKILFYFALTAAARHAALIYQRSGEDGKPKIPSLYLTQILSLLGQSLEDNDNFILSRRPGEKYKQWPQKFLDKREAALLAAISCQNKTDIIAQIAGASDDEARQFAAAHALNSANTLTPYDGITRAGNAVARRIAGRGISPSDLQILFKCPAKYLFESITLKEEERPFERASLSPMAKGTLYHEILENFYKHVKQNNLFDKLFADGAKNILKEFTDTYLHKENYKKYGIYPVAWDVLRAEMSARLAHFVGEDFKLAQQTGFTPAMFEEVMETEIKLTTVALKLRGKLDRIDISSDGKSYRIADYKTKREGAEITKAIFEKSVLQPPLYFEMAQNHPALQGKTPAVAALLGIEAEGSINKDLAYDNYLTFRQKFLDMLEYLINLAQQGTFIITPSENACQNCRFETLCRKAHHGTLKRAKASDIAKKLRGFHDIA